MKARFIGTVAQVHSFLGPRFAKDVQIITKKHKATIGQCESCGATGVPLDAAHLLGRSRRDIIHELLGSAEPGAAVDIDLGEFTEAFKFEHTPAEKAILVLCKECHTAYDTQGVTMPATSGANSPSPAPAAPGGKAPTPPVLPISFDPPGVDRFKAALLHSRAAVIEVHYRDGRVEAKQWKADGFAETSHLLQNLRSRKDFRKGVWQASGIIALRVRIAP